MRTIPWFVTCALAAAALLGAPAAAPAGVKVLWPEAFKLGAVIPNGSPERSFEAIGDRGSGGRSVYYARVRLPAGARIRGIEYLHFGTQLESQTTVKLIETHYGFPGKEGTVLFSATRSMEDLRTGEDLVPDTGSFPRVRTSRRYWLKVETSLAYVKGVKVFFRP